MYKHTTGGPNIISNKHQRAIDEQQLNQYRCCRSMYTSTPCTVHKHEQNVQKI